MGWRGLDETPKAACFSHQLKRCKGVCAGKESAAELHYLRLQQAMAAHRLKTWPFNSRIGIYEQHSFNDKSELHVFEHWV